VGWVDYVSSALVACFVALGISAKFIQCVRIFADTDEMAEASVGTEKGYMKQLQA
jgi:hypothetical protein